MNRTTQAPAGVADTDSTMGAHLHLVDDAQALDDAPPPGWNISERTDEEVSDRVAGLAGRISAATCEWLGYVAEADRRGLWAGFASTAAWLSWRCGIGPHTAADQIRVARALADLPIIRSTFAQGALSYSQVRALIRGAGIVPEEQLVELARHATGAQLERLVRALRGTVTAEEEDAAALRQRAHWHVEDDGSLVISARLTGEWAEAWMAALEQAKAQAHRQSEGPVTQAAIMATIAGRALTADVDAQPPTSTVGITADLDALLAAVALVEKEQVHATEDVSTDSPRVCGSDVSAETPRVCGSDVSAETPPWPPPTATSANVHWNTTQSPAAITTLAALLDSNQIDLIARLSDGSLVDLGRSRRRPSARLSKAVLNRHGYRCAHPHCRAKAYLHLHHVQHWSRGGSTCLDNLIPLCGRHHRALHRGQFTIGIDDTRSSIARYVFRSATGRVLSVSAWADTSQSPDTVRISEDGGLIDADRGGRSMIEVNGRAERFSLHYAVGVLLERGSLRQSG
jgi:hypothetical protein